MSMIFKTPFLYSCLFFVVIQIWQGLKPLSCVVCQILKPFIFTLHVLDIDAFDWHHFPQWEHLWRIGVPAKDSVCARVLVLN